MKKEEFIERVKKEVYKDRKDDKNKKPIKINELYDSSFKLYKKEIELIKKLNDKNLKEFLNKTLLNQEEEYLENIAQYEEKVNNIEQAYNILNEKHSITLEENDKLITELIKLKVAYNTLESKTIKNRLKCIWNKLLNKK